MAEQVETRASVGGGSPFRIFKPGQGIHVRWATAIGAGVLAISGAFFSGERIRIFALFADNRFARVGLLVALLVAAGYLIFWLVGRKQGVVDFLIATEGEMKKVTWSTRREVWGATRVVIVTVLAMATVLFLVDVLFMLFFGYINVLKHVRILEIFFGSEGG